MVSCPFRHESQCLPNIEVVLFVCLFVFLPFLFNFTVIYGLDEPHSNPSQCRNRHYLKSQELLSVKTSVGRLWGRDGSQRSRLSEPMRALVHVFIAFVSIGRFQLQVTKQAVLVPNDFNSYLSLEISDPQGWVGSSMLFSRTHFFSSFAVLPSSIS